MLTESRNRGILFTKNLAENISYVLSKTIYTDIILTKLVIDKIIKFLDEYCAVIPELAI